MKEQHYKSINTIWNNADMDEIESRIEKLPLDTIIKGSKTAAKSKPEEIINGTLILLEKYGIRCILK